MATKKKKSQATEDIDNFSFDTLCDLFEGDAVVGAAGADIKSYLHTGSRNLDWYSTERRFRGGYPSGRMGELFGQEGAGKTTLITHALIAAQKGDGVLMDWSMEGNKLIGKPSERKMLPGLAVLIDSECKYPIERAQNQGLDASKLVRIVPEDGKPMTFEQCIESMENVLNKIARIPYFQSGDAPVAVALDSLAQAPVSAELEGNGLQDGIAAKARKVRMAMRRMAQKLSRMNVFMLFTNHVYANIGSKGKVSSGGGGLKFAASYRWQVGPKYNGEITGAGGLQIGVTAEIKTMKSSFCIPPPPIDVPIMYYDGISQEKEVIDFLLGSPNPVITQSSAWVAVMMPNGDIRKMYMHDVIKEVKVNESLREHLFAIYDGLMVAPT